MAWAEAVANRKPKSRPRTAEDQGGSDSAAASKRQKVAAVPAKSSFEVGPGPVKPIMASTASSSVAQPLAPQPKRFMASPPAKLQQEPQQQCDSLLRSSAKMVPKAWLDMNCFRIFSYKESRAVLVFLLAGSSAIANYRSEGSSARSWNGEDCCLLNVLRHKETVCKKLLLQDGIVVVQHASNSGEAS